MKGKKCLYKSKEEIIIDINLKVLNFYVVLCPQV